jgi:hypothetical protein
MKPWENFDLADMPGEVWRDIASYDGLYQVSDLGRVKSLERWVERRPSGYWAKPRIRKPGKVVHEGSGQISFYVPLTDLNGVTSNHTVARLVVHAFGPSIGHGEGIHHVNGKSHDNRRCNLTCEDMGIKKRIEYELGLRENARESARTSQQVIRLANRQRGTIGMPDYVTKAPKAKTFRQGKAMVVTVVIPSKDFAGVFTSIRSASESLGIKEYSLRNALYKPHKYKRFSVTLGAHYQNLLKKDFHKLSAA